MEPNANSSVNLIRSSHTWTEADSAAGFVLRYLKPMRRQLTSALGSPSEADEALKIMIAHLVQAGFGEHKKGRLRDFLVRTIRSCAKARMNEWPEEKRDEEALSGLTTQSKNWLRVWRECILERTWRALERFEHANPKTPLYSVLRRASADQEASAESLAEQVRKVHGVDVSPDEVESFLPAARTMFAQLIADEVVETLENPTSEDVKSEIRKLGMMQAFDHVEV